MSALSCGSLFSGIGGFDLGFERAGMTCAWQAENDQAAASVLARRFPGVPNIGDVRNVGRDSVATTNLICGGFPCQDVSIAGNRAGLAGEQSGLWFEFYRVLDELRPQWVVIENVPGLLSSNGGADFATILRGLVELRYGVCWRILDAQYFGVAQRRRRVFIVGSLGDGRAAQILFESEGMFGHPPARGAAGKDVAGTIAGSSNGGGANGPGRDVDSTDTLILARPLAHGTTTDHYDASQQTYIVEPQSFDWQAGVSKDDRTWVMDQPGRTRSLSASRTLAVFGGNNGSGAIVPPLKAQSAGTGKGDSAPVVFLHTNKGRPAGRRSKHEEMVSVEPIPTTLSTDGHAQSAIAGDFGIRRLMPIEAERLQGLPDHWTAYGLTPAGKLVAQSDSVRYRQLGNAVAVPVVEWLARRIVDLTEE